MDGRKIRAAAIQMSSTPDKEENKATAEALSRESVTAGADLVALPELWSCHGLDEVYRENAEPVPGPMTEFMGDLARELGVYLLGFDPRGRARLGAVVQYFDVLRSLWGDDGGVPQDPPLRREGLGQGVPGEREHRARQRDSDRQGRRRHSGALGLLRRALPRAVQAPRAARRGDTGGPCRLHPADGQGPLGAAAPNQGSGEPGFRGRAGAVGAESRRALDVRAKHDR